ncbi:TPA: TetR/AcrR family transcriptional regulator [Listeria monocytogenes]
MEEIKDLRVQKTYEALIDAFMELYSEKGFEKITVNELCVRARIRRPTFYKHFSDKYEFFSFVVKEKQLEFNKRVEELLQTEEPSEYFIKILLVLIDIIEENIHLFYSFQSDSLMILMFKKASNEIEEIIEEKLMQTQDKGVELITDSITLTKSSVAIAGQVVVWWLEIRSNTTKQELVSRFEPIIKNFFIIK